MSSSVLESRTLFTSVHVAITTNRLFFSPLSTFNLNPVSLQERHLISGDNLYSNHNYNKANAFNLNPLAELKQQLLQRHGSACTPYILNKILSLCSKFAFFDLGVQLHSAVIKIGFNSNEYISTALVDLYGKCGAVALAHQLFNEMPSRNVVTWNSLISSYTHSQCSDIGIELFLEMHRAGVRSTPFTASAVLDGCAQLEAGKLGAQVHGLSFKSGFLCNTVVGTSLIDMYSKCFNLEASRLLFDQMPAKNVVTWTSVISGYAQNNQSDEAMVLLREMLRLSFRPNSVTYNSLLSSFGDSDDFEHVKQIHCLLIREGLENDAYLAVTLVTVYSQCSSNLVDFYKVCSNIITWDQISWNAVIAGLSNLEYGEEALVCFCTMRRDGIKADLYTLASILKALGIISALEQGKQTHAMVLKTGFASSFCVQNGLISLYAKCGRIDDSKWVFMSMDEHDIISWNSLLSGFAHHGYGREAVEIFEEMKRSGIRPNSSTFLSVLSACSHVGLLDEGLQYFDMMKNDDTFPLPEAEHYACIVDLYARAGCLLEAEDFINSMPIEPGASVYKALLSGCQVYGNKEIALRTAKKVLELCPNDPAIYVLLANVLAKGSNWDDTERLHKLMSDGGMTKKPGSSWL